MSTCISRHGEYSDHILDDLHTCTRCSVVDEDALRAELGHLRAENNRLERAVASNHDGEQLMQERLEARDGTIAELGASNARLIAEVERLQQLVRTVDLHGTGFVYRPSGIHGLREVILDPKEVTVVIPAGQKTPAEERIAELEAAICEALPDAEGRAAFDRFKTFKANHDWYKESFHEVVGQRDDEVRKVADLEAKLAEAQRERDTFREHSIWLNTIGFKAAEALGRVPDGADAVQANPIADVEELIGENARLKRELRRLRIRPCLDENMNGQECHLQAGHWPDQPHEYVAWPRPGAAETSSQASTTGGGETGPDVETSGGDEYDLPSLGRLAAETTIEITGTARRVPQLDLDEDPPPLTHLIGLDPDFTGGLSVQEHLRSQRCDNYERCKQLEAQRDKVLALHTEHEGHCMHCADWTEPVRRRAWPCPTAAIYAGSQIAPTNTQTWEQALAEAPECSEHPGVPMRPDVIGYQCPRCGRTAGKRADTGRVPETGGQTT